MLGWPLGWPVACVLGWPLSRALMTLWSPAFSRISHSPRTQAAFLVIIAFARLKALRGASEILIERENEGALKHLLDYLGLSGHKHKVF